MLIEDSMDMVRVRALTFDAGGTLLAPCPSVGAVYVERLAVHGIVAKADDIEQRFRRAFRETRENYPGPLNKECWRAIVSSSIGNLIAPEKFPALFDDLWQTFSESRRWSLLPGVETTLASLHASGIRMAVFSNNDERLHGVLNGLGLVHFFQNIFVSSDIGWDKPDPRAFDAVRAALGVPASSILHVGDSLEEDYLGARAAGWQTVLVSPKPPSQGIACISRLDELIPLLA